MRITLHLAKGPEAGRIFNFEEAESFLIGRSSKAHLRLDPKADRHISRNHCLIEIRPPRCILWDLDSRNGTFVNEKRIKFAELKNGDQIRVGRSVIEVVISETGDAAARAAAATKPLSQAPLLSPADDFDGNSTAGLEIDAQTPLSSATQDRPQARHFCVICEREVTDLANSDGLAGALDHSLYYCPSCALERRDPDHTIKQLEEYVVLGVLGRGGMGVVYQVVHMNTGRVMALKMILPELITNQYASRVFDREIQVQSKVVHKNLVRVLDHGQADGVPFFVTEFLSGKDVKNLVEWEFQGPLSPRLTVYIGIQVLDGLSALHARGFIHRDLKPSNFLLDRPHTESGFKVKIADYGLAKSFEDAGNSIFEYTTEGISAGSYVFIPPEQITNYKYVKPPVDLYAVGVSMYWMLTGKYSVDWPMLGDRPPAGEKKSKPRHPIEIVLEDHPIPLADRNPDLPKDLAAVIDRAVVKDPNQRFQSARAFRMELEKIATHHGWARLVSA